MNNLSEKFKFLTFMNGITKLVMQNKKIFQTYLDK